MLSIVSLKKTVNFLHPLFDPACLHDSETLRNGLRSCRWETMRLGAGDRARARRIEPKEFPAPALEGLSDRPMRRHANAARAYQSSEGLASPKAQRHIKILLSS